MKFYAAIHNASGSWVCKLLAKDEVDARAKLTEQLKRNRSRLPYYNGWADLGFPLAEFNDKGEQVK